jgi:hypothetical protein
VALLNIYADLNRVALALEEIGHALRELVRQRQPQEPVRPPRKRIRVEDMVDCTPAALVGRQDEEALRERLGMSKVYKDKLGRLLYPADFPDGYPDAETRDQTVENS